LLDGPEVSTPDERVSVGTIETELLPDISEPFADEYANVVAGTEII
jgi:hypothetical protein